METQSHRHIEAKELKTLHLDHLLGSLITHEMMLHEHQSKRKEEIPLKALYTQACLRPFKEDKWHLESHYAAHTVGDKSMFSCPSSKDDGHVTYGNNGKGKITGESKVCIHKKFITSCLFMVSSIIY